MNRISENGWAIPKNLIHAVTGFLKWEEREGEKMFRETAAEKYLKFLERHTYIYRFKLSEPRSYSVENQI